MEVCVIMNDLENNFIITTSRTKLSFMILPWIIAVSIHAELMLCQSGLMAVASDGPQSSLMWEAELQWAVYPVFSHTSLKV